MVAATSRASRLFWSWVSSKAKMIAVKGDRVTPAIAPAIPMRAHTPGVVPGRTWPEHTAEGCPHHHDRGQDASAGSRAQCPRPDHQLHHEQRHQRTDPELAQQLGVDGVVADAEGPGIDQPTDSDEEPPIIGHHIQWTCPVSFLKTSSNR